MKPRSKPLRNKLFLKGLKPAADKKDHKRYMEILEKMDGLAESKSTAGDVLITKNKLKGSGDIDMTFYGITPADNNKKKKEGKPKNTTKMAVVYVPGNMETVAAQYNNKYLKFLAEDLQS